MSLSPCHCPATSEGWGSPRVSPVPRAPAEPWWHQAALVASRCRTPQQREQCGTLNLCAPVVPPAPLSGIMQPAATSLLPLTVTLQKGHSPLQHPLGVLAPSRPRLSKLSQNQEGISAHPCDLRDRSPPTALRVQQCPKTPHRTTPQRTRTKTTQAFLTGAGNEPREWPRPFDHKQRLRARGGAPLPPAPSSGFPRGAAPSPAPPAPPRPPGSPSTPGALPAFPGASRCPWRRRRQLPWCPIQVQSSAAFLTAAGGARGLAAPAGKKGIFFFFFFIVGGVQKEEFAWQSEEPVRQHGGSGGAGNGCLVCGRRSGFALPGLCEPAEQPPRAGSKSQTQANEEENSHF